MANPGAPKPRVLIAEDYAPIRESMVRLLNKDFTVEAVGDGSELLSTAENFRPDIVLLDVAMPGIDGHEVCRRLRANPTFKFVKIAFVSARVTLEDRLKGYEAGGDDYIVKPFDSAELLAKLRVLTRLKTMEEVNQIKNDFMMLVSHETRTPIVAMTGLCECLMSMPSLDVPEARLFIVRLQKNAERLSNLAEKTLLACKLRDNSLFKSEAFSIRDLIAKLDLSLRESEHQQNVSIQEDFADAVLLGNRGYIKTALEYLLDNAMKFSPDGGQIRLSGRAVDQFYEIRVCDEGTGIDPARKESLFDFFVVDNVLNHHTGLGLSLGIARQIAINHNGSLTLEQKEAKGATFLLRLPYEIGS